MLHPSPLYAKPSSWHEFVLELQGNNQQRHHMQRCGVYMHMVRSFSQLNPKTKQPQGLCLKFWDPFPSMVRHVQAEHQIDKCHPRWTILSQAIKASLGAVEGRIFLNTGVLHLQYWLWGYPSPGGQALGFK